MTATQNTSLEQLQKENSELKNEINYLKEQLGWFKRNLFGKRSEKIVPRDENQLEFDGFGNLPEEEKEEKKTVSSHTRRKPKRNGKDKITLPEDIPTETTVLDIPEEEKVCPETGKPLVKIGEEVTHKLAYKPGSYYLKKIIRLKYASPDRPENGISIAPLPESLMDRCFADESLLADIMVKKYADHLPLYRQSEMRAREEIKISRQVLCQWVMRAGMALKPLYTLMKNKILESGNVFVDETPVKMLDPGRGKAKEAYAWVLVGGKAQDPPYRYYQFYKDRKHCNAEQLLKDYHDILHSDKYGAYVTLANKKQIIWCPCWSHIRRKFFEVESGDLKFRDWMLRKIKYLFMYERVAWARNPEERLRIRQEKEVLIIDEMIEKVKEKLHDPKLLPKSKLKEAINYFCGLVPYLKNYTAYAFARLDNNVSERAIRPLAIGRKNWLFVGSEDGGEVSGIIYSLVQTCRGLGVNPQYYLEDVMRRIMTHPANNLDELLPDKWGLANGLPKS
jgi:transposase